MCAREHERCLNLGKYFMERVYAARRGGTGRPAEDRPPLTELSVVAVATSDNPARRWISSRIAVCNS